MVLNAHLAVYDACWHCSWVTKSPAWYILIALAANLKVQLFDWFWHRQDMEIEVDRFEIARSQLAEVGLPSFIAICAWAHSLTLSMSTMGGPQCNRVAVNVSIYLFFNAVTDYYHAWSLQLSQLRCILLGMQQHQPSLLWFKVV